jgi:ubiquinone/menaquinone biosynthesis C-methylase UbiE
MDNHVSKVAEAFSRKARIYDDFAVDHENLARMRQKVRDHALAYLRPGDRLLELNAGTGADAVFFARLGFQVHATDISPGMLAQIREKVDRFDLSGRLTVEQRSFSELEGVAGGPFHYVFSNMGGVNCVADLTPITRGLARLLVPEAVVTWVVMPPVCLWELSLALRGDFKTATRRFSRRGTLANVEGVRFTTYYHPPARVIRAFGPDFLPIKIQGLSVFTPTADVKEFPRRYPRLYRLLRRLDDRLSDWPPFNRWGDFFILSLKYRPGRHAG